MFAARSLHRMQSVWITSKMREGEVDADLQSAWTWIKETMQYDKWDRVKVLMLGADRKSLRSYFSEWHVLMQQQSDAKARAAHQAELEALHTRYQQELDDVNQVRERERGGGGGREGGGGGGWG